MKLSEILKDWPEKYDREMVMNKFKDATELHKHIAHLVITSVNETITSCDREIDREALKEIINKFYHLQLEESGAFADRIISTMPTWLKPTERK